MTRVYMLVALIMLSCILSIGPIAASPFVLTFDGLKHDEPVADFYDGGFGGMGSGPGPDFNVTFPSHALAFGPLSPVPGPILYWDTPSKSNITINVPNGFDTGFSFLYTSEVPGAVWIYDGPNGAGNLLAKKTLPDLNFEQTNFALAPVELPFSGIARSVVLGNDSDLIIFDDLTFGSVQPGVPEPTTLSLIACGATSAVLSRRLGPLRRNRSRASSPGGRPRG